VTSPVIDITAAAPGGVSRWDTNGDGAIHALDAALEKAGLPDALRPALTLLDRAQELVDAGRTERDRAHQLVERAARRLVTPEGDVNVAEYGDLLASVAVWIDEASPASLGVGDAARQVRQRAVLVAFGMASGLHSQLRDRARDVVAEIARIDDPPADLWRLQKSAEASVSMIRAGRETDWAQYVRLSDQWTAIHAAARLVRETRQLDNELIFPGGCPVDLGLLYLNWQGAVGAEQLRQTPGPLRVRKAHDLGWLPGLWTASDHRAFAEQQKPKRGLFAGRR
jgi:hypothetical protein